MGAPVVARESTQKCHLQAAAWKLLEVTSSTSTVIAPCIAAHSLN